MTLNVPHLESRTTATHFTIAYCGNTLGTGVVGQGTTAIAATSINIICTAMTIDALLAAPVGVALRGIRFSRFRAVKNRPDRARRRQAAAFVHRLGEFGWTEDRTITILYRWAEGRAERYGEIAAEFVRRKVNVIVAS